MKFLCEHCKAKYQIADEKVAGKTVRMKCRKCGNAIEVRAEVTETSVNAHVPTDPPRGYQGASDPAKVIRPTRSLATSLSNAPKPPLARPASSRSPEGGTLADAFHRNVQREEEIPVALDLRELSAADEWYVAINGVPVGPIRMAELRRKAAVGVVNEDSLCWQEGMEEWRPVRAVSELAAVVREAAAGGRISLVTPPPPESRPSVLPARSPSTRPGAPSTSPRGPRSMGVSGAPSATSALVARSNVVPITSRLSTAEKLNEEPVRGPAGAAAMFASDPFAQPTAPSSYHGVAPTAAATGYGPAAAPAGDPFGSQLAPARASQLPASSVAAESVAFRKSPPFTAIAMIVLAGAFGITAAIVLLKPAPQVVVQVPSAAPAGQVAQAPAAAATSTAAPANPGENVAAAQPGGAAGSARVASAAHPSAPPPATAKQPPTAATSATDPALRDLINGTVSGSGPTAGPSDSTNSGGAQMTEDQVTRVLSQHTTAVKRTCWERIQTQSSSVNVTVHIVVAPTGQVSSATSSGNDPVVGHCIEGEVRRWTFPGSGTIDIPFHFLRQ